MSEFALSGSIGVQGSGALNIIPQWTGTGTLGSSSIIDYGGVVRINSGMEGVHYIEGKSGRISLDFYSPYNVTDPTIRLYSGTLHIGNNSGFLRDNSGDIELKLATSKKFKITYV
ncbi:MAG: hypothetical protein FIB08_03680 [Candidatus Methanoperedens sp.]|nr:hypothetical protein [Candidatus Methanoperedens sp.]